MDCKSIIYKSILYNLNVIAPVPVHCLSITFFSEKQKFFHVPYVSEQLLLK